MNKEEFLKRMKIITDLVFRVNMETKKAVWLDVSGHVSWFTIRECEDKEDTADCMKYLAQYVDYSVVCTPEPILSKETIEEKLKLLDIYTIETIGKLQGLLNE